MNFRFTFLKSAVVVAFLSLLALSFSIETARAQPDPLTLAEVLTALQSRSAGLTMAQKNAFILKRVQERGVTFRVTAELEKELRAAGATTALIAAIRLKSPGANPTPTPIRTGTAPTVKFNRIWIDYNVKEEERNGMRIHTAFTVYNMQNVKGYLAVYFARKSGEMLKTTNTEYSSRAGQVAVYRSIAPVRNTEIFNDFSVFIPYTEFNLPPRKEQYELTLEANLIYEDGKLIQKLDNYDFVFTNPVASPPVFTMSPIQVEYNVTENRKKGMRVNIKLNVQNMVGIESYLAVWFEKQNGDKLYTTNRAYSTKDGHTGFYQLLKPLYVSTNFNNLQFFIPYDEFIVPRGTHDLRIHVDVLYPDGELIQHLDFYPFRYTK